MNSEGGREREGRNTEHGRHDAQAGIGFGLVGAANAEAREGRQARGSEGFGGGGGGGFGGHGECGECLLSKWVNGLRHDHMHVTV